MRHAALLAASLAALIPATVCARTQSDDQQESVDFILTLHALSNVQNGRASCAAGQMPANIAAARRAAGSTARADAADECVALLTRLGREGKLDFIGIADQPAKTAAQRFDDGFVTGYRRQEPIAASLPTRAALRVLSERCLSNGEPNLQACYSAGYVHGLRSSNADAILVP